MKDASMIPTAKENPKPDPWNAVTEIIKLLNLTSTELDYKTLELPEKLKNQKI